MLLRVNVVTSDFKKFYVTISCHEEQIIGFKYMKVHEHSSTSLINREALELHTKRNLKL